MQCELEGTMKKTDIGVVGFMYAVCAFFFLMSRDLKKGARIYPLCIIAILFLLTTGYVVEMLFAAKKNGVTRTEMAEILTHAAFYAGWPKAWAAFRMAKEVWTGDAESIAIDSLNAYAQSIIFPVGKPNDAYAKYFIGKSYLAPIVATGVPIANVTFEPGCRNNWHIHHATKGGGQTLVCVGGRGYYQEWGKEPVELFPGDAVYISAGVKHWHGAAPDSWFSHLAIEAPGENKSNEWLEPVSEDEYSGVVRHQR